MRRGRITEASMTQSVAAIVNLPISIAPLPLEEAVFTLAHRNRLTFYDAAYLELAQREAIALATLDGALARAATAEGVALIGGA